MSSTAEERGHSIDVNCNIVIDSEYLFPVGTLKWKITETMQVEVTAAINLIAASLYHKLPRRRVDAFAEELEKGIITKFQGHWYPDNPSKGAAYRCINVSGEKVDPVIIYSVINSGEQKNQ